MDERETSMVCDYIYITAGVYMGAAFLTGNLAIYVQLPFHSRKGFKNKHNVSISYVKDISDKHKQGKGSSVEVAILGGWVWKTVLEQLHLSRVVNSRSCGILGEQSSRERKG